MPEEESRLADRLGLNIAGYKAMDLVIDPVHYGDDSSSSNTSSIMKQDVELTG